MSVTPAALHQALAGVVDPELRLPITELGMVEALDCTADGVASARILLTIAGCPLKATLAADAETALRSVPGVSEVQLQLGVMSPEQRQALRDQLRPQRGIPFNEPGSLTQVYAIASGKGGVGKSSVTANLACSLAARGLKVGIVDADIYGFSIPGQMGLVDNGQIRKPTKIEDMILPPVAHGVKVISIGMFLNDNQPVAWRGPMLHRALEQFLTDVYFGDLDVLLLDLPPGTGDVAISVSQLLPVAQLLVVTTPQPAAADVAERAGALTKGTGQSVAGVIENMSAMVQPDGSLLELFGSGGGAEVARRLSSITEHPVPLLGQIPLDMQLRLASDAGAPVVLSEPGSPAAVELENVAAALVNKPRGLAGVPLGVRVR